MSFGGQCYGLAPDASQTLMYSWWEGALGRAGIMGWYRRPPGGRWGLAEETVPGHGLEGPSLFLAPSLNLLSASGQDTTSVPLPDLPPCHFCLALAHHAGTNTSSKLLI